jgi:hypothetical protein
MDVLLSEIDVLEAVEQLPRISRRSHISETQLWSDPTLPKPPFDLGFPRFRISPLIARSANRLIKIEIETTFDPSEDGERAKFTRDNFMERLSDWQPSLCAELKQRGIELHIEFLPPGTLNMRTKPSV